MMTIFVEELKESALLSIGHRQGLAEFHNRSLHLKETDEGIVLRRMSRKKRTTLWRKAKDMVAGLRSSNAAPAV